MTGTRLTVGIGERDITPGSPVPLAGFAMRQNQPYVDIARRLWVRAWWFSDGETAALLVVADVLWWAPERVQSLRSAISVRWSVPVKNIMLHATHTHSAPQTSAVHTIGLGTADAGWVAMFEAETMHAIDLAWKGRSPAVMHCYDGHTSIGYNRRVLLDDPGAAPDDIGNVNEALTAITVTTPTGDPRGLLIHAACHPTVTASLVVSSEYPGIACEMLRHRFGPVSFLQGACADINPKITRGRPERDLTDDHVQSVAEQLVEDVHRTVGQKAMEIDARRVRAHEIVVPCPVKSVPSEADLEIARSNGGLLADWASALQRHPERIANALPLVLTRLSFGDALGFVGISAEVATDYGRALSKLSQESLLCLGYSNGMTGYIMTAQQLENGGYESVEAPLYFASPGPFTSELEHLVLDGLDAITSTEAHA